MISLSRIISVFVIAIGTLLSPASRAEAPETGQLLGKWQHVSIVRTIDGKTAAPQISDGKSSAEFLPNGTWSLTSGANRAGGTYRWLDKRHIEQTILESGLAIQIGIVSIKEIRVDATKLEIITMQTRAEMDKFLPPVKAGDRRPNEVVITSVFSRLPAK